MPPLSRWLIKCGFVSLALALLLELLQLRPVTLLPRLPAAALHLGAIHLLTVGWLLQLIIGVAFWMFPRHPTRPPRGDERLGWWALGLINSGLLLRLVGESWRLGFQGPAWPLVASALLQLAGVSVAVLLIWPRVRAT
ncbi:MAG TPA: hypothetical protein VG692_20760 [Gemmatimonadales bacterium]|nr:hypothetical protein [Gemmatimonadales bacterium]